MPPKKRSLTGFLNYSKRKDIKSTGEGESNIHSACIARVRREVESDEASVVGESSGEVMAGAGSELTRGDSDDEYDSTVKRVRIEEVRVMAAEPLDGWVDNLPRVCSIWLYFCIQIFPKNLVFKKPIQLLL